MTTFRELVYIVLDELKTLSDDRYIEEEHIMFLLQKHRLAILEEEKREYNYIATDNLQTVFFNMTTSPAVSGLPCEGGNYLKSNTKIPNIAFINGLEADTAFAIIIRDTEDENVYTTPWFSENISYVNRKRFMYVGHNKYLNNILYITQGADGYLYGVSQNETFLDLASTEDNNVEFYITTVFKDAITAITLSKNYDPTIDILDYDFPIDNKLIPKLINLCLRELLGVAYRPKDPKNNASDDLSTIATFIRQNMKNPFNKLLEGEV